jgi:hypothetical protein
MIIVASSSAFDSDIYILKQWCSTKLAVLRRLFIIVAKTAITMQIVRQQLNIPVTSSLSYSQWFLIGLQEYYLNLHRHSSLAYGDMLWLLDKALFRPRAS